MSAHACNRSFAQVCPGQPLPPRPDIILSTGKVIAHRYMCNGAVAALSMAPMSEQEWREYCHALKRLSPKE